MAPPGMRRPRSACVNGGCNDKAISRSRERQARRRRLAACAVVVALAAGLSLTGAMAAQAQGTAPLCQETSFQCINNGAHNTQAYITASDSNWAAVLFDNKVVWEGNKPTYRVVNDNTGLCLDYVYATEKVWWESCAGSTKDPDLNEQFWLDWPYVINWGGTLDEGNVRSYLANADGGSHLYCVTEAQLGSFSYAVWMWGT
jgi:hypothetical protein